MYMYYRLQTTYKMADFQIAACVNSFRQLSLPDTHGLEWRLTMANKGAAQWLTHEHKSLQMYDTSQIVFTPTGMFVWKCFTVQFGMLEIDTVVTGVDAAT